MPNTVRHAAKTDPTGGPKGCPRYTGVDSSDNRAL